MRSVAASGRTVLVVSHQLDVINRLCRRAVWLDRGRVAATGPAAEVVAAYLSGAGMIAAAGVPVDLTSAVRSGSGAARFTRVSVCGAAGAPLHSGGPMRVDLWIDATERMTADAVAVTLYDLSGYKLMNADTVALGRAIELVPGANAVRFDIRAVHLNPGRYRLACGWPATRTGCSTPWKRPARSNCFPTRASRSARGPPTTASFSASST